MESEIEKLVTLQSMDRELDSIRAGANEAQSKRAAIQFQYEEKKNKLDTAQAELSTLEKEHLNLEDELKLEEQRLRKSRTRLNEIKTNFEYQAMRREIESTERSNRELEDQIISKMEEIEKAKKILEKLQEDFGAVEKELTTAQEEEKVKTAEAEGLLKLKQEERKALEGEVAPALLNRYQSIRRQIFDALVEIQSGVCQGCFMNIPPQMANEIQRGQSGIFQCPNCQRLLYLPT